MSQIHRCRFLDSEGSHITALAFNYKSTSITQPAPSNLLLAVGRSNGNIEIWNPQLNWNLEFTIQGSKNRSIESIVWSSDHLRLYTVGATEKITEWDLEKMEPIGHYDGFAGIIWAIEASLDGKKLAAVTETGIAVLFDISQGKGQCDFIKRLPSADTSLACVTWLSNTRLVAGGADARLRVWDVPSNRIIATMKVDKGSGPDKTLVWKVIALPNGQFVSGDSNGFIKFWDTKTLSLHQSFEAHPGDVLCLASDSTGNSVFSSGLDQKIVLFKVTNEKLKRWTIMSSKVAHSHDIRCMTSYESKNLSYLVSGGLEQNMVLNSVKSFDSRSSKKLPIPAVGVKTAGNYLYSFDELKVSIWHISEGNRRKIAEVNVGGEEHIYACALDVRSELLLIGTRHSFRMFNLVGLGSNKVTDIHRVYEDLPFTANNGIVWAQFISEHKVVYVNFYNELHILDLKTQKTQELELGHDQNKVKTTSLAYANNFKLAEISPDSKKLAVCKFNNYVELYDLSKLRVLNTLPRPDEPITALAFRDNKQLLVATVFQNIYEFELSKMTLSKWSKQFSKCLPPKLLQQTSNCKGIFNDPAKQSRVWLWGNSWLAYLDLNTTKPYFSRKRKVDNEVTEVEISEGDAPAFWLTTKYKPIQFAGDFLGEILVSEIPRIGGVQSQFWQNKIKI